MQKQQFKVVHSDGKAKRPSPKGGGKNHFTVKGLPDPSWTEKQLAEAARYQWGEIQIGEKKLAIHVFRLGAALNLLKPSLKKKRQWEKFLKEMGLSTASAWRAMELCQRAKTEDQVIGLSITESYLTFGILSQPKVPNDDDEQNGTAGGKKGRKKTIGAKTPKPRTTNAQNAPVKKAKKTVTNSPKDNEQGATGDIEQPDEEDEPFDAWAVLDEFATRSRWDKQRQAQIMVDYWGPDVLEMLIRDVGYEADLREFLAEQEKMPPTKESNSPLGVLVMLRNRINLMVSEVKAVDWAKESASDYRQRLDEIAAAVEQLRKGVPQ